MGTSNILNGWVEMKNATSAKSNRKYSLKALSNFQLQYAIYSDFSIIKQSKIIFWL